MLFSIGLLCIQTLFLHQELFKVFYCWLICYEKKIINRPGVKRGFIKGEVIRLLRTNSSETHFQEAISNFKTRLKARYYPKNLIDGTLSEVKVSRRQ